ncbi:MAG: ABC transporter substrate-binding protein, partial [Pseudomonadales bacterium]|nr:ABC transporter substrate-binding protein [Pseudomonadales bacterium]
PLRIVDPAGRRMTIKQPPKRIVSATLAGDEMLMELVDQEKIKGVTYLVDQPAYPHVNGFYDASILRNHAGIEEILSVEPDLVLIASYSNAASVEMLLATGIPLIRIAHYNSHQDLRRNVRMLSRVLGVQIKGERWIAEMDKKIEHVKNQVKGQPKPRVLYYSMGGLTRAPGTLMDESIGYAGGHNVLEETGLTGYTSISKELAISLLPDVILLDDRMLKNQGEGRKQLLNDPAWADVPAIKNKRVYSERNPLLLSVTPARVEALEQLARWLHPTVFENPFKTESSL